MNFLNSILQLPELNGIIYAINPRGNSKGVLLEVFISSIIEYKSSTKVAEHLNIGIQTFNRNIKKLFPNVKLQGGGQSWDKYLLDRAGFKRCNKCSQILGKDFFHNEKDALAPECKDCKKLVNKKYYDSNKHIWENYLEEHKSEYAFRNAKRRALLLQRTPKWLSNKDIEIIKQMYECAEGCHVDHIIPLQGELVSGLHVPDNLQYLTPEENLSKNNKFEI